MDIVIIIAMLFMLVVAGNYVTAWSAQGRPMTSPHLRSATLLLLCFTVLAVLVFGMRLFLQPTVGVAYAASTQPIFSNVTPAKDGSRVIETKALSTCKVTFYRSYPMMLVVGTDSTVHNYKMPCDELSTDMKGDIAMTIGYLKGTVHNEK